MDRLTDNYVPGNGDLGHSKILYGLPPILKSDPACEIQGSIERVRNSIEKLLSTSELLQPELNYLLGYLNRNIFSLASFCYMKGDSSRHLMSTDIIYFMDKEIEKLKKELGSVPDFIYQTHVTLAYLDAIRIEVRALERDYVAWWYSSKISRFLMEREDLIKGVRIYAAILNRLSAYLFEATRKEAAIMRDKGIPLVEKYWQASMEEWNPPVEEDSKVVSISKLVSPPELLIA
ncbi:hypothetical protein H6G33_10110 [Calothrix sp. FACHB-1219]|uniref:hypothetical protein n=1 Tax=unclassified Calothrix TaxID=2619626 RepID=UPI001682ADFB|nr:MULTISPECIES: hypothetical protein [unclassified Calothrix]MBD2201701.1 hypothetical protein [Calothrix sp. FACHB-168]MBD2217387.1 hypothetical protein [Calothrix sp. FACHB-1219]